MSASFPCVSDGGVRVHVPVPVRAGGVADAAGYKQPTDPQMKDLFLPFRCFCTRKDVRNALHHIKRSSSVAVAPRCDFTMPVPVCAAYMQIHCKDVVLDDHDVAKSVVEFAAHGAVEKLVVGASARGGFVR